MRYAIAASAWLLCASASAQNYFPTGIFEDGRGWGKMQDDAYSEALRVLKEQSLWELSKVDKSAHAFRMVLVPPAWPASAKRVTINADGSATLTEKTANRTASMELSRLEKTKVVSLSRDRIRKLNAAAVEVRFWSLPTLPPPVKGPTTIEFDAALCVLEGISGGAYHAINCDGWNGERRAGVLENLIWDSVGAVKKTSH